MVDVKDLRIGNWVYLPGLSKEAYNNENVPFIVQGIYQDEDGYKVSCHCDTKDGYNCTEEAFLEGIEPIPLTRELLLKLGNEEYGIFYIGYSFELSYREDDGTDKLFVSVNCSEYIISPPIEYLHQLQNIYFDLEGNELEVKL